MNEIIKSGKSDKFTFDCKACGGCCTGSKGFIWLTASEQKQIADYLGLTLQEFLNKYTKKSDGKISLIEVQKKKNDYWCVFLDKNKKCKIYDMRPHQCKTYPYWQDIIDDEEYLYFTANSCRGITLNKNNRYYIYIT